jgi:hypothetical protein
MAFAQDVRQVSGVIRQSKSTQIDHMGTHNNQKRTIHVALVSIIVRGYDWTPITTQ